MPFDTAAPAKTYFDSQARRLIYSAADEATIREAKADIKAACHSWNCRNIAFWALDHTGLMQLASVYRTGGDLEGPHRLNVHGSLRLAPSRPLSRSKDQRARHGEGSL